MRSCRITARTLTSLLVLTVIASCERSPAEQDVPAPLFNAVPPAPNAVRIQAFTLGPNGEIMQPPNSYQLCQSGFVVVNSETSIQFQRNCENRVVNGTYQPYNGGTADIWLFSPSGQVTHLGHLEARFEYLDFYDVPTGWTVRFGAYPSPTGARFNWWYDPSGIYSTQPIVDVSAFGGLSLLAEFQKESTGGGGGGGEGCQQIVC